MLFNTSDELKLINMPTLVQETVVLSYMPF